MRRRLAQRQQAVKRRAGKQHGVGDLRARVIRREIDEHAVQRIGRDRQHQRGVTHGRQARRNADRNHRRHHAQKRDRNADDLTARGLLFQNDGGSQQRQRRYAGQKHAALRHRRLANAHRFADEIQARTKQRHAQQRPKPPAPQPNLDKPQRHAQAHHRQRDDKPPAQQRKGARRFRRPLGEQIAQAVEHLAPQRAQAAAQSSIFFHPFIPLSEAASCGRSARNRPAPRAGRRSAPSSRDTFRRRA